MLYVIFRLQLEQAQAKIQTLESSRQDHQRVLNSVGELEVYGGCWHKCCLGLSPSRVESVG
jgi:hypothetical protein